MTDLDAFNKQLLRSIETKDGTLLSQLLCMNSASASAALGVYTMRGGDLISEASGAWSDVHTFVQDRFGAGAALIANNWVEACAYLSRAMNTYLTILSQDTAWSLPLLQSLCRDIRVVAIEADNQLQAEGMQASRLADVERILKRAFIATNNDRNATAGESRRRGTLDVINQLLKTYFHLNNLRMCRSIIDVAEAPTFPHFESTFPVGQRVTYKYFAGRLHLYADRRLSAVRDLTYAFRNTPDCYEVNRRLELLYLIPARILCGFLPPQRLLDRYRMGWYSGIVSALRTGNLRDFNDTMERYEEFFISRALFLTMEKLRQLVYRALCKKIFRINEGNNKISIDSFRRALKICGEDVQANEAECILANLIYNNVVRGYISHKVGFLVLSKKNPFPKLTLEES